MSVGWDGCWHYADGSGGKVWALIIRRVGDGRDDHIPKLPDGQWWVAAIAVDRDELHNSHISSDGMKVVLCPITQQVNTVVESDGYCVTRTVRNPNKGG